MAAASPYMSGFVDGYVVNAVVNWIPVVVAHRRLKISVLVLPSSAFIEDYVGRQQFADCAALVVGVSGAFRIVEGKRNRVGLAIWVVGVANAPVNVSNGTVGPVCYVILGYPVSCAEVPADACIRSGVPAVAAAVRILDYVVCLKRLVGALAGKPPSGCCEVHGCGGGFGRYGCQKYQCNQTSQNFAFHLADPQALRESLLFAFHQVR